MFDRVGIAEFVRYETDHTRLMSLIVVPPMMIELVTAAALIGFAPAGFPRWAAWAGLAMVGILWLSQT